MNKNFPENNEFHESYLNCIKKFENFSVKGLIKYRNKKVKRILNSISIKNSIFFFKKKELSLKEIIQNLIDCERNFIYLAFLILRYKNIKIRYPIPKDIYIQNFILEHRSLNSLKKELFSLYVSTYYFFENLSSKELKLYQHIYDNNFSVRAIVYIFCSQSIDYSKITKQKTIKKK